MSGGICDELSRIMFVHSFSVCSWQAQILSACVSCFRPQNSSRNFRSHSALRHCRFTSEPPCPTEGYLWNPGYSVYGDTSFCWIHQLSVAPARVGLLWTPALLGFASGVYRSHAGYWDPRVGFYGGMKHRFGFGRWASSGGEWRGGHFAYDTAVVHVNLEDLPRHLRRPHGGPHDCGEPSRL